MLGVSRRAIQRWESGDDVPQFDRIPQICESLDKPAAWFVDPELARVSELFDDITWGYNQIFHHILRERAEKRGRRYDPSEQFLVPAGDLRYAQAGLDDPQAAPQYLDEAKGLVDQSFRRAHQLMESQHRDGLEKIMYAMSESLASAFERMDQAATPAPTKAEIEELKPIELVKHFELKAAGWAAWSPEDLWQLQLALTRFCRKRGLERWMVEAALRDDPDLDDTARDMLLQAYAAAKKRRPVVNGSPAPTGKSFWLPGDLVEHGAAGIAKISLVGPAGACPAGSVQLEYEKGGIAVVDETELHPVALMRGKKKADAAHFGTCLFRARQQAGYSRSDFAERCGFKESKLAQMEKGKDSKGNAPIPSARVLDQILDALPRRLEPFVRACYPVTDGGGGQQIVPRRKGGGSQEATGTG